jgi:hypothetical protein
MVAGDIRNRDSAPRLAESLKTVDDRGVFLIFANGPKTDEWRNVTGDDPFVKEIPEYDHVSNVSPPLDFGQKVPERLDVFDAPSIGMVSLHAPFIAEVNIADKDFLPHYAPLLQNIHNSLS